MAINSNQKLTNSTDETSIGSLLSGDLVFGIPYFQRAYKWDSKKILRFQEDLDNLLEIDEASHFLGAIIVFSKITNPSEPSYYEVIDGQQRLTTCFLALTALCHTFAKFEMLDDAVGLYQRYIVIVRPTKQITNAKLISCLEDRAGVNEVFQILNSNLSFYDRIKESNCVYKKMPTSGTRKDSKMVTNFKLFCKHFSDLYEREEKQNPGLGRNTLNKVYEKLVNFMSVVQIVVKNPTDGPIIFNSLNSKQEPITIGDLVRNEVFSRLSQDEDEIEKLDRDLWRPFYTKFWQCNNPNGDKIFEQYFFPYVLTIDHTVKKNEAFNYLREAWNSKNKSPEEIIDELSQYQDIYLDLCYGTNLCECHASIKPCINKLAKLGAPTSIYPFLFHVISASVSGNLDIDTACSILSKIESFLVRRMVCGYEPTGLHAAFKALWDECDGDYSLNNVVKCLKNHNTVTWPDDSEFEQSIKTRSLYKVKATPYILAEWDRNLGGDSPILPTTQQIEHVLPEHPDKESQWNSDWTKEEFEKKKDCLANLLPLSASINQSIQNADYAAKRERYLMDSALKSPRDFATKYANWTPIEFDIRANELWAWAEFRWPY